MTDSTPCSAPPAVNAAPLGDSGLVPERSLDPADWETFRRLARRMVDDAVDYLRDVRDRPVWQPVPSEVRARLSGPPPREGQPLEQVYADFRRDVLPYPVGNIHPRFWGWVNGTGTPDAALADFWASIMDPNAGGFDQSSQWVERQVVDWFRELFGFPVGASGILVSGGSVANLVGLAVARSAGAEAGGWDVRAAGLQGHHQRLVLYASAQAHASVQKAAEILGLGRDAVRVVPVDGRMRIRPSELHSMITDDRASGLRPFCVVGGAGTVNTGAFDDLEALADICSDERLWFHVDGAFGALLALSDRHRHLVRGLERADSIAFDLHKWLYLPYEVGGTLVRDPARHLAAFSQSPDYLMSASRGPTAAPWFSDLGIQLSRGFRALKVWVAVRHHGIDAFTAAIDRNVEQAQHLARLVDSHPELERLADAPSNVVCFRYTPRELVEGGACDLWLDELNREILLNMQESGFAMPSSTTLGERYSIRVAITNHRTAMADIDALVEEVVRLGRKLGEAGRANVANA
jgi:glutamate/tyrosine decarboxylase-like PLP-dependent enzyme